MPDDWLDCMAQPHAPETETVSARRVPYVVIGLVAAAVAPAAVSFASWAGSSWLAATGRYYRVTSLFGATEPTAGNGVGAVEYLVGLLGWSVIEMLAACGAAGTFLVLLSCIVLSISPPSLHMGESHLVYRAPMRKVVRIPWQDIECFVVARHSGDAPDLRKRGAPPEAVYWVGRAEGDPPRAAALRVPGHWTMSPQSLKAKLTRHLWRRFPDRASHRHVYRNVSPSEGCAETLSAHR